jgi:Lectin C-type domain
MNLNQQHVYHQLSQPKARNVCCKMGMSLLSIKSSAKRRTLSNLAIKYPEFVGDMWTSGSDLNCVGAFRWCSVNRAFIKKEVRWGEKEPNLKRGNCVMARLHVNESQNTFSTANCKDEKQFVCEVNVSKKNN